MECVIVEKNIFGDFVGSRISDRRHAVAYVNTGKHRRKYYRKCDVIYRYLHIELIWRLLMVQYLQKQCYYEMDYSFYSFYWLDSLVTIIATLGVLWASRRTTGRPAQGCDYCNYTLYKQNARFRRETHASRGNAQFVRCLERIVLDSVRKQTTWVISPCINLYILTI